MRVTLLNLEGPAGRCVNKDYAGGFGTAFRAGTSWRSRLLEGVKKSGIKQPLMALGYLAAIFRRAGHDVEVLTNRLPEGETDLVLIPSSLVDHKQERAAGIELRRRLPGRVGVFGTFASTRPDAYEDACDFLIKGEPEAVALRIAGERELPRGLIESPPLKDLDSLPFPAWDLFPVNTYSYRPTLPGRPVLSVLGSRGCPYTCNYCPYIVAFESYRHRSVDNVIAELRELKQRYGLRAVTFRDAIFTVKRSHTEALMKRMIDERIDLRFNCETRLDRLDTDLLDLMRRAGLAAVEVGIESASEATLRHVERIPIATQHQENMVRHCDRIGVKVVAFYVLGLPTDDEDTVHHTMAYSKHLNTYAASFSIATPMPGSGMYEEIKDRIFDHDWEHFDTFTPVWRHETFSSERLEALREHAFTSYYFRPRYILSFLRRTVRR